MYIIIESTWKCFRQKLYLVSVFPNGLKYSESVAKMLNMTQDVDRQLSTAPNMETVAKFSEIVVKDLT